MIERVAKRLARRELSDRGKMMLDGDPGYWVQAFGDKERAEYRGTARAAIEAMREPTEAMINLEELPYSPGEVKGFWQAMIDEALK
jgi:hypothetical protein